VEKYKARPAMLRLADTYEIFAKPIKWKFTKTDLNIILSRLPSGNFIIESLAA
jgi:hypothetical protein